MDNQGNGSLSLAYYYQGKSMEELWQSLLYTTLELETTRIAAQDEIRKRDEQMIHLEDLLNRAITEKNEAQEKCQRLLMDKLVLLQQPQQQTTPLSGISSIDDEQRRGGGDSYTAISSSDCEESIVSSPAAVDPFLSEILKGIPEKPLPEKGKLLQAVMKAGPLLQTLLLAGPLPQWQHPPPPLNFFERPPVIIPSSPHFLYHHASSMVNITGTNNNNNSHGSFPNKKRSLVIGDGSDISSKIPSIKVVLCIDNQTNSTSKPLDFQYDDLPNLIAYRIVEHLVY